MHRPSGRVFALTKLHSDATYCQTPCCASTYEEERKRETKQRERERENVSRGKRNEKLLGRVQRVRTSARESVATSSKEDLSGPRQSRFKQNETEERKTREGEENVHGRFLDRSWTSRDRDREKEERKRGFTERDRLVKGRREETAH